MSMVGMGVGITKGGQGPWSAFTTDVPLAPEAGLVIGLFVGWLSRRMSA